MSSKTGGTAAKDASAAQAQVAKAGGAAPASGLSQKTPAGATGTATQSNLQQQSQNHTAMIPDASGDASAASTLPVEVPAGSVLLMLKISSARNIRGLKGEHVNSFVRVQFADFDYKESTVAVDTSSPEYNFSAEHMLHIDESLIDSFANKRVTITIIESLPKEKTQILGTGEFLLSTLVKYERQRNPQDLSTPIDEIPITPPPLQIKEFVPITYLNPKLLPPNAVPPKEPLADPASLWPEITVEASISNLLIPMDVADAGNFITLKVDDLFPVPEEWTLKEGTEKDLNSNVFNYSVSFMIPAESSLERQVTLHGGILTNYEAPNQDTPTLGAQPIMIKSPERKNVLLALSGAHQDKSRESVRSRNDPSSSGTPASGEKPKEGTVAALSDSNQPMQTYRKVSWGQREHIIWMPPEAVVRLREKITSKQPLEVEFFRELQPKFAHLTDPTPLKYRGKALVDVSSLLFPRVTGLKGRFSVDSFDAPSTPDLDTTNAKGKAGKPKEEVDLTLYKNLGTHLGLEISLGKPLLDKKKLLPITKTVNDFIPRRTIPAHMLYEKRSERADEDYRTQVQEVVRGLVKEYKSIILTDLADIRDHFEGIASKSADEEIQRHKKFLYQLNKSGAYFSLKERLKATVVNIVRERFQKKSPFATKAELQLFMSEVYVYLVDQMHVSINKMFKDPESAFIDPTVSKTSDFNMLKMFADHAELDKNMSIAGSYHQERIAKYEDSMQAWFDYGGFCMRNGKHAKGEECFKEILSRNAKHIPSLLAYGALCLCAEKYDEARVYFTTAMELQPKYFLPVTLLGLYYETIGEEFESEKILDEAEKLKPGDVPCLYLHTAKFLVQLHAGQLVERSLAHALLQNGPMVEPYLVLSKLEEQRGNLALATEHINAALEIKQDDPDAWAALGHLHFTHKEWAESRAAYETVLSLSKDPANVTLTYTRLGCLYLMQAGSLSQTLKSNSELEYAKKAKSMFLRGCEVGPTAQSWLGVGKVCIMLGNLDEAEDALAEANVLNNRESEVWAYLALMCLMKSRQFEANQCISQALRQGIKEPEVLKLLGTKFLDVNQLTSATECFRMALELDPDCAATKAKFAKALTSQSRDFLASSKQAQVTQEELNELFSDEKHGADGSVGGLVTGEASIVMGGQGEGLSV